MLAACGVLLKVQLHVVPSGAGLATCAPPAVGYTHDCNKIPRKTKCKIWWIQRSKHLFPIWKCVLTLFKVRLACAGNRQVRAYCSPRPVLLLALRLHLGTDFVALVPTARGAKMLYLHTPPLTTSFTLSSCPQRSTGHLSYYCAVRPNALQPLIRARPP